MPYLRTHKTREITLTIERTNKQIHREFCDEWVDCSLERKHQTKVQLELGK